MSQERTLNAALKEAAGNPVVCPFFAVHADFPSGAVRLWSGLGNLVFDGNTYLGAGELLAVDLVEESVDGSARGISVMLSGIPSEVLDPVTLDNYHGRDATLYFGCLEEGSGNVITEPIALFAGKMDTDEVTESGESSTVRIKIEHRLSDLLRKREWRYSLESQHALQDATTDDGLEFVPSLQEANIRWGEG